MDLYGDLDDRQALAEEWYGFVGFRIQGDRALTVMMRARDRSGVVVLDIGARTYVVPPAGRFAFTFGGDLDVLRVISREAATFRRVGMRVTEPAEPLTFVEVDGRRYAAPSDHLYRLRAGA